MKSSGKMRCIGSSRARATHLVFVFAGDMNSYNVFENPDECLPDNALHERQDRGSTELSTFFLKTPGIGGDQ